MLSNFPNIINKFLGDLPKDDYPVLDTFKFVSCWLSFVMDRSQFSGINLLTAEPGGILIHFGQGHDSKYGEETIAAGASNGCGRGQKVKKDERITPSRKKTN